MAATTGFDTLDMSLYFGTADQKQDFCGSLLRLLKARGCVKIQNHGIPNEKIHQLFFFFFSPIGSHDSS